MGHRRDRPRHRARSPEHADADVSINPSVLYERVLPALPVSVPRVRFELGRALASYDVDEARRADIASVVTEATTNAVLHAYPRHRPGPLYVAAALLRSSLIVSVVDGGRGVLPRAESPSLGMGWIVMTRLADDLRLLSDRAAGTTCVEATFDDVVRSWSPTGPETARRDLMREYIRVLRTSNAVVREDTAAVLAQASQAVMHARRLRQRRAQQRVTGLTEQPRGRARLRGGPA